MISGYLKGSTHIYSADLQLLIPRELMIFKKIVSMDDPVENLGSTAALTRVFLSTVIDSKEDSIIVNKEVNNIKSVVLKKFRVYLKAQCKDDRLEIDECLKTE